MYDYSISEAFQQIEEHLINSMIRNMSHHISEEKKEGFRYSQWQAEQLAALAEYRTANEKRFKGYFSTVNDSIELALRRAHKSGKMAQEAQILEALKRGWEGRRVSKGGRMTAEFFRINEQKLTAYINAVVKDMERAETALLRMADDQYRKTIFNAGVAYNTGAYTLPQAIDAATKDYLSKGLACIEYKNGARVLIDTYAEMALRTSVTRCYLMGESAKRDEWGINTVIVARRGAACPKCLQYVGRVFYDDVYGSIPVPDDRYPRLSEAIEGGLYHPNCKDIHTTYFEGVSSPPKPLTPAQEKRAAEIYGLEQRQRYNERQIRRFRRLADNTLDPAQKQKYSDKLKQWQQVNADFVEAHGDVLKRRYEREDIRGLAVRVERPPVSANKPLDKSGRTSVDVTAVYASSATPGSGNITYDDGYDVPRHSVETKFAEWLHSYYGGDIHLLGESKEDGVKMADYLWNGKLWDLKTATTEKSANGLIRKGLKQIDSNPGGIILDYQDNKISLDLLAEYIDKRMKWHDGKNVDIMVVQNNMVVRVIRYK